MRWCASLASFFHRAVNSSLLQKLVSENWLKGSLKTGYWKGFSCIQAGIFAKVSEWMIGTSSYWLSESKAASSIKLLLLLQMGKY